MRVIECAAKDEDLAVRYLLGQLKSREKVAFEERYFQDQALFEFVCAVEDELIDRFLQNRLSWWRSRRFKAAYSTPDRKKRVAAAERLMQAFAPAHRRPFLRSVIELLRAQKRGTQMALALVTIAVTIGPWLILDILLRQNRVQTNAAGPPPAQTARPTVAPTMPFASVLLKPGAVRGETAGRFAIPKTASLVNVELALPGNTAEGEYRVLLLIAGGIEVWRESLLTAHQTSTGLAVGVSLPAELLRHTDYIFVLERKGRANHFSEVATYEFALERE